MFSVPHDLALELQVSRRESAVRVDSTRQRNSCHKARVCSRSIHLEKRKPLKQVCAIKDDPNNTEPENYRKRCVSNLPALVDEPAAAPTTAVHVNLDRELKPPTDPFFSFSSFNFQLPPVNGCM